MRHILRLAVSFLLALSLLAVTAGSGWADEYPPGCVKRCEEKIGGWLNICLATYCTRG
jgi:hypothetical protein